MFLRRHGLVMRGRQRMQCTAAGVVRPGVVRTPFCVVGAVQTRASTICFWLVPVQSHLLHATHDASVYTAESCVVMLLSELLPSASIGRIYIRAVPSF